MTLPLFKVTRASQSVLFNLQYIRQYLSYYIQPSHDGWLMDATIITLMLVSMTLIFMQGHSGSANAKHSALNAIGN